MIPKLTNAQIYTLRRMNSRTKYVMRGDGKKGCERRPDVRRAFGYDDVNAASIPVLYRLDLINFVIDRGQEPTKFYHVQLTDKGREAAETLQIAEKD